MNGIIENHYKGITHPDSLRWCHGSIGLEHAKIRKFRYPLYKYVRIYEKRIVVCVCLNCNMTFWGDDIKDIPLSIPVYKDPSSYFYYRIPVTVNGKLVTFRKQIDRATRLGWANQEIINESTRQFIEMVQ